MISLCVSHLFFASHLYFFFSRYGDHRVLHVLTHSFPTRRSSDLYPRLRRGRLSPHPEYPARRRARRQLDRRGMGQNRKRQRRCRWHDQCFGQSHSRRDRSEEHTSELQSLMRISYAVFCLKKKKNTDKTR